MIETDNGHYCRSKLESMSTAELIKLADSCGIDMPAGLERIFIIEELLEFSKNGETESNGELEINPVYAETVPLPKQYNISFVEVMVRDPLWVFVFWEIKSHDREIYENARDFGGYFLRIIPLEEGEAKTKSGEDLFTVPVSPEDCARYIGIAEHSPQDKCCYAIKLGVKRGDSEYQIAVSRPYYLPHLIGSEEISSLKEKPLLMMSGVSDISIIRNSSRQPVNKKV